MARQVPVERLGDVAAVAVAFGLGTLLSGTVSALGADPAGTTTAISVGVAAATSGSLWAGALGGFVSSIAANWASDLRRATWLRHRRHAAGPGPHLDPDLAQAAHDALQSAMKLLADEWPRSPAGHHAARSDADLNAYVTDLFQRLGQAPDALYGVASSNTALLPAVTDWLRGADAGQPLDWHPWLRVCLALEQAEPEHVVVEYLARRLVPTVAQELAEALKRNQRARDAFFLLVLATSASALRKIESRTDTLAEDTRAIRTTLVTVQETLAALTAAERDARLGAAVERFAEELRAGLLDAITQEGARLQDALEQSAERRHAEVLAAIDRRDPPIQDAARLEDDLIPQEKEHQRHAAYTDRPGWRAHVETFLTDPGRQSGYLLLVAGEGAGKSGFVSHAVQERPDTVYHFIRRTEPGWDDPERMLRSLAARLLRNHGLPAHRGLRERLDRATTADDRARVAAELFSDALTRVSEILAPRGARELLWIDGLDEAFGPTGPYHDVPGLPGLFPGLLPPGIFAVLTSRPGDHLRWLRDPRLCVQHHLEGELLRNVQDVARYFYEHAEDVSPPLDAPFIQRAAARSQGNFYIAVEVLAAIARDPAAPRDPEAIPSSVHDYHAEVYGRVVERARRAGLGEADVRDALGLVALTPAPLTPEHLDAFDLPASAEEVLTLAAEYFRQRPPRPAPTVPYEFNHTSIPEFLTAELTRAEQQAIRERLLAACRRWQTLAGEPRRYALRHLPAMLAEAGCRDELRTLLLSFAWLRAKIELSGVDAAVTDYALAGDDRTLTLVAGALRLFAHVLRDDPSQLGGQLVGRLLAADDPDVRRLLAEIDAGQPRPWLRPLWPGLDPPGGPRLQTLQGHQDRVTAVTVTPDGQRAVSGSDDRTLIVWDLASGRPLQTLQGHQGWVTAVAVTPDGQRAVSASVDGTLIVWDLASGQPLQTLQGHQDWVWAVAVTPDGQRAVSASVDGTLIVWDLASGQPLQTFEGHQREVTAVTVTPDGQRAVSGSDDRTLIVWDLASGQPLQTLQGHQREVTAVTVTPDGQRAVSGSDDRTLIVWDLASGQPLQTLQGRQDWVTAVAVTPDGQRAVSASDDRTLVVWDLTSGQPLQTLQGHLGLVTAVAVTPDGQRAVSASWDRTLIVWDLASGQPLQTLQGHLGRVWAVAVTPDGQRAVSGSSDGTLIVWDLASGQPACRFTADSVVLACAVTPDGSAVVAGDAGGRLHHLQIEQ